MERRRSRAVNITLLSALAAMASSCEEGDVKRCMDNQGRVVDESRCANAPSHGGGTGMYFWAFGGHGGTTPGSTVSGYSRSPIAGRSYATPHTISRGGFGRIGGARGGFGS